jgi:hypothetical protein
VSASKSATAPRRKDGRPCVELLNDAVVEVLRRKTPKERVAMILAANRTMRLRLEGHLRDIAGMLQVSGDEIDTA